MAAAHVSPARPSQAVLAGTSSAALRHSHRQQAVQADLHSQYCPPGSAGAHAYGHGEQTTGALYAASHDRYPHRHKAAF